MSSAREVEAGHAVYSRFVLSIYDAWVLGISNRFFWRCPTPVQLAAFSAQVSANHLDVGVGTGYYLDHCRFPVAQPRLGLMDLNANSLAVTAERIGRFAPESYRANVLEPITDEVAPFDSISLQYLMHCLPGTMADKAVIFDHLDPLLNPGGAIFGATILADLGRPNAVARKLMAIYNKKGIFSNTQDTADTLEQALTSRYEDVHLVPCGCVMRFSARKRA